MNEKLLRSKRRKKILFSCLATSLILHVILLCIIYKNPVVFKSSFPLFFSRTSSSLNLEEDLIPLEKSKILEEVFNQRDIASFQRRPLLDQEILEDQPILHPYFEEITALPLPSSLSSLENPIEVSSPSLLPSPIEEESLALVDTDYLLPLFPQAEIERDPTLFQTPPLPKEFFYNEMASLPPVLLSPQEFPSITKTETPHIQEVEIPFSFPLSTPLPPQDFFSKQQLLVPFKTLNQPFDLPSSVSSIVKNEELPSITSYELPESRPTLDWGDYFDIDVQVTADPSGEGHLFSLSLKPSAQLSAQKLKQNFTFLIDRSNSIDKMRYETFKKATLRALSSLKEGDAFNVIVFDRKIYRLNDTPLPFSKATLSQAREFLASKPYSNLFTATEIYLMLEKILKKPLTEDEVHTVFLLSDGNTMMHLKKQQKAMLRLTEENDGKLSLYTVAAGSDNNLPLLDLLSSSNRGRFIYSRTHAALPRKLTKALMDMRTPVAKEISLSALSSSPESVIELFPPSYRTPTLDGKEPYLIFGKIDKLSNFTLLIDGRNRDQWISIQKEISFAKAKKRTALLDKKWALQEVKGHYEAFLKEGKPASLKKAEQTLKTYGGAVAFE